MKTTLLSTSRACYDGVLTIGLRRSSQKPLPGNVTMENIAKQCVFIIRARFVCCGLLNKDLDEQHVNEIFEMLDNITTHPVNSNLSVITCDHSLCLDYHYGRNGIPATLFFGVGNCDLSLLEDKLKSFYHAVDYSEEDNQSEYWNFDRLREFGNFQPPTEFVDVPQAPDGVNIDENIKLGDEHKYDYRWMYDTFKNYAPMDYKRSGSEYEDFGNFNYGAVALAAGIPEEILKRAAGWVQENSGAANPKFGHWWGDPPYGDDPEDQIQIQNGMNYYRNLTNQPIETVEESYVDDDRLWP